MKQRIETILIVWSMVWSQSELAAQVLKCRAVAACPYPYKAAGRPPQVIIKSCWHLVPSKLYTWSSVLTRLQTRNMTYCWKHLCGWLLHGKVAEGGIVALTFLLLILLLALTGHVSTTLNIFTSPGKVQEILLTHLLWKALLEVKFLTDESKYCVNWVGPILTYKFFVEFWKLISLEAHRSINKPPPPPNTCTRADFCWVIPV